MTAQSLGLIGLCLILVPLAAGWTLQRVGLRWGAWISAFGHLFARAAVIVAFLVTAVQAADAGGAWFALAALMSLFALFGLALLAFSVWALVKYGVHNEDMT